MLVDLRHLLRHLRRSPASAAAAVVTLALTVGAGGSIFAVVDAVLLTPPPFANPEALVTIGDAPIADVAARPRTVLYGTYEAWRARAGSLAVLEASDGTNLTLTGLGAAQRISGSYVTPGFFPLLGVTAARGRTFTADDVAQRMVIVSHAFWCGKLSGDPNAIGRQIVLGGRAHTIVGVLPESVFFALGSDDVWLPFAMTPARAIATGQRVGVIARLAANVQAADVERALDEVSRSLTPPARVIATPLATALAGDATRTLGLLAGAAALAMLIAFTNLAGLLIVRAIDRRRELAVRTALGAHRFEIARQLLLEAQALVLMGTVAGVLLAAWMTPAVARLALQQFGAWASRDIAISWRVIIGVAIVASVCAAVCGSLPALVAARRSVVDVLRRGVTPAPRELVMRRIAVIAEVAVAFVLLVSVTLLGRGVLRLLEVNPGFDPRGVLTTALAVPAASYPTDARVVSFYSTLHGALEARLGARTVAVIDEIPMVGSLARSLVRATPTDAGRESVLRSAGTAYFDVMRMPVLAGRGFDQTDNAAAPPRVIVSQALAERLFGANAEASIGRRVWVGANAATAQESEVIGVVGDVKHRSLDESSTSPTVYVSAWQVPSRGTHLVVRSTRPDADVLAAVREEVARLDRDVPVYAVRSLQDVVAASPGMPTRRVLTATFMGFAVLAVVLSAIGLFGVVAHDVARRRAELALRMALGAHPLQILRATFGQGALMVGAGLALGLLLSFWTTRALGGFVFGPTGLDPLTLVVAATILFVTGAAAILPAARRAAHTDPLIALRSE